MRKKKALSAWIPLVSVFCSSGAVSGIRGKQMMPAVASERNIFSKNHDYNTYTRPRVFCACVLTLSDLETKWDPVNMQTGWKLEPCFMVDSSPSPSSENSNGDPLPLATPPALPDPIVSNPIVPNSIVPNPIVLNPIVAIVPTPANESTVIVDSDVATPVNLPNNSPTHSTTSGSSTTAPNYATVNKSRPLSGDQ